MKAWIVYDAFNVYDGSIVVFAETRGKAISEALGEDEFEELEYVDLRAKRYLIADGKDKGHKWRLDFENPDDRHFLVSHGWHCSDEIYDPDDCVSCACNDICEYHKSKLELELEAENG